MARPLLGSPLLPCSVGNPGRWQGSQELAPPSTGSARQEVWASERAPREPHGPTLGRRSAAAAPKPSLPLDEEPAQLPALTLQAAVRRAPPGPGCCPSEKWVDAQFPGQRGEGQKTEQGAGRGGGGRERGGVGQGGRCRAKMGPARSTVSPSFGVSIRPSFPPSSPRAPPSPKEQGGLGTNPVEKKWPHIFRDVLNIVLATPRLLLGQSHPDMEQAWPASGPGLALL